MSAMASRVDRLDDRVTVPPFEECGRFCIEVVTNYDERVGEARTRS